MKARAEYREPSLRLQDAIPFQVKNLSALPESMHNIVASVPPSLLVNSLFLLSSTFHLRHSYPHGRHNKPLEVVLKVSECTGYDCRSKTRYGMPPKSSPFKHRAMTEYGHHTRRLLPPHLPLPLPGILSNKLLKMSSSQKRT